MQINYTENREFREFLKNKIRAFNNKHSHYHKESRTEGYTKYVEIREEENGQFIAGMCARIYWGMMYLDTLYIEQSHRKAGLGKKLLTKTIDIAKENNCKYIALETYSFQAKDFYEKYGFIVVGALEDYPPGETFYTMKKLL